MRREPTCYRLSKRNALEKFLHLIKRPIADIVSVPPVAGVTMEASWFSEAANCRSADRFWLDPSLHQLRLPRCPESNLAKRRAVVFRRHDASDALRC